MQQTVAHNKQCSLPVRLVRLISTLKVRVWSVYERLQLVGLCLFVEAVRRKGHAVPDPAVRTASKYWVPLQTSWILFLRLDQVGQLAKLAILTIVQKTAFVSCLADLPLRASGCQLQSCRWLRQQPGF